MRTRLGAAVLGILAGALLIAGGGLAFLDHEEADWHRLIAVGGYAVAVGALLLLGYGLVGTAPVWLRLIVSVGLPLLAVSVWQVVAEAIDQRIDGWRGPATIHLSAGVVVGVFGLLAARGQGDRDRGYRPTHR
jgi:hypothetical protein